MPYDDFVVSIENRLNFILTSYARECSIALESLPIVKNKDILFNIFNFGLLEKMDKVFETKRRKINEKSL